VRLTLAEQVQIGAVQDIDDAAHKVSLWLRPTGERDLKCYNALRCGDERNPV
jgi:hypothetical protein